jgi:hypothetical protein
VCDKSGRCALHLVAEYSESPELLQDILLIDHKMTKMVIKSDEKTITPLGLLCRRRHFPAFDAMVSCLIEVDSSVAVIYDGMINHIKSYDECLSQDISPGSRGAMSLILLGTLLDSNPAVTKFENSRFFSLACMYLRGELGVSVLSLLLTKDSTGINAIGNGSLPIHVAADYSCLDVLKFLHKVWPESILRLDDEGSNLLHLAVMDDASDIADVTAKVQYIYDQCPALIHLRNIRGKTPLYSILTNDDRFNLECVKILCNLDATVAKDRCSTQLPLHILIESQSLMSEVSDEADCFRLLLRLYPAAAGIEDGRSRIPYDIALSKNLSSYFKRLLLAADPSFAPVRRHHLNFAARRQGMFLAYRALSSVTEPTIWTKLRLKGRDLLQHVISYL